MSLSRYWHLPAPQESFVIGAESSQQPQVSIIVSRSTREQVQVSNKQNQVKARLVEGTEVLVEGGKVMGRQTKEEGVRLLAEVIGHAFDSTLLMFSSML